MSFVRSNWKLLPCPMKPVPTSSKLDTALARTESIHDGGSTSATTNLGAREGVDSLQYQRSENMGEKQTALLAPRPVKKVLQDQSRDSCEDHGRQLSPSSPWGSPVEQRSPAASEGAFHAKTDGCPRQAVAL
ncbi:hypothetical protein TURU_106436 [Turdus rufiventris]|nr:hypothetical protein TURU_106436 [Turdus rufiventris]